LNEKLEFIKQKMSTPFSSTAFMKLNIHIFKSNLIEHCFGITVARA